MSKTSRHNPKCLEVTVMFEPHRLQHDLLHTAYALLLPLPRRHLAATQSSAVPARVQPQKSTERSVS
jgi:hypothetical protein